jgi:hypothetical protein
VKTGYSPAQIKREVIQKAMAQRPFRRFSVRLTDGRLVLIQGEHHAAVHPKGDTMIVFEEKGGYRIIDLPLSTELESRLVAEQGLHLGYYFIHQFGWRLADEFGVAAPPVQGSKVVSQHYPLHGQAVGEC